MKAVTTQRQAKLLVLDYLRETERKGVTSFLRDLRKYHRTQELFSKRAFEKWLKTPGRQLQDRNWLLVQEFVQSAEFQKHVPYANEGPAAKRLRRVAKGFVALYGDTSRSDGIHVLPSALDVQGREAVKLLNGHWENNPNLSQGDVPRTICRMQAVKGERYAKFAYIALFRSKQISATGLVIYLNSQERENYDYYHLFALQLWRRRDPETGSNMPGELTYFGAKSDQPEFSISRALNTYFYQESDSMASNREVTLDVIEGGTQNKIIGKQAPEERVRWVFNQYAKSNVLLTRCAEPISEEKLIIDQLLEDVLPHGYA